MAAQTPLALYVDQLSQPWKWNVPTLPHDLHAEWQAWLAAAQRAEDDTLLRYWAQRSRRAA